RFVLGSIVEHPSRDPFEIAFGEEASPGPKGAPAGGESARGEKGKAEAEEVRDVEQTGCVVAGAGPAGGMRPLLLARKGGPVTLREAHKDSDREFRGDTLHPAILDIMDQLGLAERLHRLRHTKVHAATIQAANGPFTPVDFRRLKVKYPYIMLVPQA